MHCCRLIDIKCIAETVYSHITRQWIVLIPLDEEINTSAWACNADFLKHSDGAFIILVGKISGKNKLIAPVDALLMRYLLKRSDRGRKHGSVDRLDIFNHSFQVARNIIAILLDGDLCFQKIALHRKHAPKTCRIEQSQPCIMWEHKRYSYNKRL